MKNIKYFLFIVILLSFSLSCATLGINSQATTIAEQNTKIAELSGVTPGAKLDVTQSNTPEPLSTDISNRDALVQTMSANLTQSTQDLSDEAKKTAAAQTISVRLTEQSQGLSNDVNTPCGDWRVFPIAAYQASLGNGWKSLMVELAVENNSDYWGSMRVIHADVSVTTEDGFRYISEGRIDIPETPQSPYSGSSFYASRWAFVDTYLIPPGFIATGWLDNTGNDIERYLYGFRIAETQQHPVINIEKMSGHCIKEGGEYESFTVSSSTPIEDIQPAILPTKKPANSFKNLNQPIDYFNLGEINFVSIERGADSLVLRLQFTNASSGYEASGEVKGYVIGDDGVFRLNDCDIVSCFDPGSFIAGPGQTVYGEALGYSIPETVQNLKFVWVDKILGVYQVFNVNP